MSRTVPHSLTQSRTADTNKRGEKVPRKFFLLVPSVSTSVFPPQTYYSCLGARTFSLLVCPIAYGAWQCVDSTAEVTFLCRSVLCMHRFVCVGNRNLTKWNVGEASGQWCSAHRYSFSKVYIHFTFSFCKCSPRQQQHYSIIVCTLKFAKKVKGHPSSSSL